jgi:hypothetical protein
VVTMTLPSRRCAGLCNGPKSDLVGILEAERESGCK